jgi:hypothetical protein
MPGAALIEFGSTGQTTPLQTMTNAREPALADRGERLAASTDLAGSRQHPTAQIPSIIQARSSR